MAGELVKWMGGGLVKRSSALQRCREAREAALSVMRPETQITGATSACPNCGRQVMAGPKFCASCGTPAVLGTAEPSRFYPGLVVDLPRMCALDGKPYAARYIFGNDGRFRLGSMIAVTEAVYLRRYAGNQDAVSVPYADLGEEICPLCSAFRAGRASVLCGACKNEVCYGRTSGVYFRCFCGGEGVLEKIARVHTGVTPMRVR